MLKIFRPVHVFNPAIDTLDHLKGHRRAYISSTIQKVIRQSCFKMSADRPEEGGSTKQARMWTRFVFLWRSRTRLDDGMALDEPLGDLWQHLLIGCGEFGEFTVLSAGWNQMRVGVNLPGFSNRQIAATPLNDCTLGVPIELVRAGHPDVTDFTSMEAGELGDPKSPCRRAPPISCTR